MDALQLLQAGLGARVHAGDQLQLRLAEVGGDVRVGERRAELARVRRQRERARRRRAQALLLDAAAQPEQRLARKGLQVSRLSAARLRTEALRWEESPRRRRASRSRERAGW